MDEAAGTLQDASTIGAERTRTFLDRFTRQMGGDSGAADCLAGAAKRMRVFDEPFPYGVIDDFLPRDLYDEVLSSWPSQDLVRVASLPQRVVGKVAEPDAAYAAQRMSALMDEVPPSANSPQPSGVFATLAGALKAPAFVADLIAPFLDTIEGNLNTLGDITSDTAGFRLYVCQDGGERDALGAHLDAMRKLVTIVVYLDLMGPTDGTSADVWGTTLYRVDPGSIEPLRFTPNDQHQPARRVEFVANRAFVMPNDHAAYHGVAGGQRDVTRRTLMCGYWLFSGDS